LCVSRTIAAKARDAREEWLDRLSTNYLKRVMIDYSSTFITHV